MLSACSNGKIPGVYRIDVQQGNVLTSEMLEKVELGMDKRKVRFLLGTPLVTDAFHQDRWDYFYSYEPGSGRRVQQRVALFFEAERLARIDAEINPDIEFHTVVEARETVFVVPPEGNRGFFAFLAPASKSSEVDADDARSEDGTVSGDAAAAGTSSATSAAATEGSTGGDEIAPREIYAPNAPASNAKAGPSGEQFGHGDTAVPGPVGTVGFSTTGTSTVDPAAGDDESEYLEALFDDFGASNEAPAPAPPQSEPAPGPVPISSPRD
jgi:outer membrane protein assembly factor BamE